jgi:hypothetical protein
MRRGWRFLRSRSLRDDARWSLPGDNHENEVTGSLSGPRPPRAAALSIAPPEQRETYCHECLAENPRTRATCVNCGARLRHPKEYADVVRDLTPKVSEATFGNVGAAICVALYGVAIAVLMPQWLAQNIAVFGGVAIVVFVVGRFAGRFIARHLNDSSI